MTDYRFDFSKVLEKGNTIRESIRNELKDTLDSVKDKKEFNNKFYESEYFKKLSLKQQENLRISLNLGLPVRIASILYHYSTKDNYKYKQELEDYISIGFIGLIKAANTFDESKYTSFQTYASRCIQNEILMHIRKEEAKKQPSYINASTYYDINDYDITISLIENVAGKNNIKEYIDEIEEKEILSDIFECFNELSKKEMDVLTELYGLFGKKAKSQKEIQKSLGLSQPGMSRFKNRAISKIRRKLKEKHGYNFNSSDLELK